MTIATQSAARSLLNCSESLSRAPSVSLVLSDSLVVHPVVASTSTRWKLAKRQPQYYPGHLHRPGC